MIPVLKPGLLGVCLLLTLPLLSPGSFAAKSTNTSGYHEKLDRLQASIRKIQEHLKGTRSRRGHILTELNQLESNISRNAITLKTTEKTIQSLNRQVKTLKQAVQTLNVQAEKQRKALAAQLRSSYAMGAQQSLKMLLNQQNPAEMGRIQAYFDYLNRARQEQISQFINAIETRQRMQTQLNQTLTSQENALSTRKKQKRDLQKQRLKRNQLLAQIEIKIKNQETTLSELAVSRNRIENLLMSLGELLADIPAAPGSTKPFKEQRGHLPWPAAGAFLAHYGQSRHQGDLKWNGVLIGAPYGTPVKAISHGRVAFADWLQGFGFITIVDHGDGYMSLYGHNQSLLKQTGDWVDAGEVIATIGDSGGQPTSGLYFEIRSRGKPVNPASWCSNKIQHPAS